MIKTQNNGSVHCKKCETSPMKIAVYENFGTGNLFTSKFEPTAENLIIPARVWVDESGAVCIEVHRNKPCIANQLLQAGEPLN